MADVIENEPADIKPVEERKDDWMERGTAYNAAGTADTNDVPVADEKAIGSPDVFLNEHYRGEEHARTKVYQVWGDGTQRGYIVLDSNAATPKVGYFEMAEGMSQAEAEHVLRHAYENTAVLV